MPVLSEDSGECPPPWLYVPGLAGLGEMRKNNTQKKQDQSCGVTSGSCCLPTLQT